MNERKTMLLARRQKGLTGYCFKYIYRPFLPPNWWCYCQPHNMFPVISKGLANQLQKFLLLIVDNCWNLWTYYNPGMYLDQDRTTVHQAFSFLDIDNSIYKLTIYKGESPLFGSYIRYADFKYVYYSDYAICTYSHTEKGSNLVQPYGLIESLYTSIKRNSGSQRTFTSVFYIM